MIGIADAGFWVFVGLTLKSVTACDAASVNGLPALSSEYTPRSSTVIPVPDTLNSRPMFRRPVAPVLAPGLPPSLYASIGVAQAALVQPLRPIAAPKIKASRIIKPSLDDRTAGSEYLNTIK